jgi:diguanylate cyclase (GGDEF)-like protein
MLAIVMAAVSLSLARRMPGRGLNEWGTAMLCGAGGCLLLFLRGHIPWFLTFVVANVLFMGVFASAVVAYARLLEVDVPWAVIGAASAVGISGVLATFFGAPHAVVVTTTSVAISFKLGLAIALIHRNVAKITPQLAWITYGTIGLTCATFALRAIIALSGQQAPVAQSSSSIPQVVALFVGAMLFALSTTGFVSMASERNRRDAVNRLQRDGLTGLFTRTAFLEMFAETSQLGEKDGYAVILLDIDNFKAINDEFGHMGGDAALAHAARLIVSSIRLTDIAVRYGGDEFCLLLRNCSEETAAELAERLIEEARKQTIRTHDGRTLAFTFSAGYACHVVDEAAPGKTDTLASVIEKADRALYRAKQAGRNQAYPKIAA